jgi:hypothetical protein
MSETNEWGADPEKYAKLAEPIPALDAQALGNAFLKAIGHLREQYHIPELLVQFVVYVDDGQAMKGGAGWGDQMKQAQLARRMADQEYAHLIRVLASIVNAMPDAADMLITDPSAEGAPDPEL